MTPLPQAPLSAAAVRATVGVPGWPWEGLPPETRAALLSLSAVDLYQDAMHARTAARTLRALARNGKAVDPARARQEATYCYQYALGLLHWARMDVAELRRVLRDLGYSDVEPRRRRPVYDSGNGGEVSQR